MKNEMIDLPAILIFQSLKDKEKEYPVCTIPLDIIKQALASKGLEVVEKEVLVGLRTPDNLKPEDCLVKEPELPEKIIGENVTYGSLVTYMLIVFAKLNSYHDCIQDLRDRVEKMESKDEI
jgi:hypothetical protein